MNALEAIDAMIDDPSMANGIRAHRLVCRDRDEGTLSKKWADKYLDELAKWMGEEIKTFRAKYEGAENIK